MVLFGTDKLKDIREEANLTKKDICDFLEISMEDYEAAENGVSKIPMDKLERLLCFYGISVKDFIFRYPEVKGINFSLEEKTVNKEIMNLIADTNKIALNLKDMVDILETE